LLDASGICNPQVAHHCTSHIHRHYGLAHRPGQPLAFTTHLRGDRTVFRRRTRKPAYGFFEGTTAELGARSMLELVTALLIESL